MTVDLIMFLETSKAAKLVKIPYFHQPKKKSRIRKKVLDRLTLLYSLYHWIDPLDKH